MEISDNQTELDEPPMSYSNTIFQKHIKALTVDPGHVVSLSLSALLNIPLDSYQSRSVYTTLNIPQALLKLLQIRRFDDMKIPQQYQTEIKEKAFQLLSILSTDASGAILAAANPLMTISMYLININQFRSLSLFPAYASFYQGAQESGLNIVLTQLSAFTQNVEKRQSIGKLNLLMIKLASQFSQHNQIRKVAFELYSQRIASLVKHFFKVFPSKIVQFNVVQKVYRPNLQINQEIIEFVASLLMFVYGLFKSVNFKKLLLTEDLFNSLQLCIYSNNQSIYRTTVQIISQISTNSTGLCIIQHNQQMLQKLCLLLSPAEPQKFLYAASQLLGNLSNLDDGDVILKQIGAIQPIVTLLTIDDENVRLAACQVVISIIELHDDIKDEDGGESSVFNINEGIAREFAHKNLIQVLYQNLFKQMRILQITTKDEKVKIEKAKPMFQEEGAGGENDKEIEVKIPQTTDELYQYRVDPQKAKMQNYANITSTLLHATSAALCCPFIVSQAKQMQELFQVITYLLKSSNPTTLKWASKCLANAARSPDILKIVLQTEVTEYLFGVFQRLIYFKNKQKFMLFNQYVSEQVVAAVADALISILKNKQKSELIGREVQNLFGIIMQCLQQTRTANARCLLLGLIGRLVRTEENAQIFLEYKLVDYLSFLILELYKMTENAFQLREQICNCLSSLCSGACVRRNHKMTSKQYNHQIYQQVTLVKTPSAVKNHEVQQINDNKIQFYGQFNVSAELGFREVIPALVSFLRPSSNKIKKLPAQEFASLKSAVQAVEVMSHIGRNSLLFYKYQTIPLLIYLLSIGDLELQQMAASAIRTIRQVLQAFTDAKREVKTDQGVFQLCEGAKASPSQTLDVEAKIVVEADDQFEYEAPMVEVQEI